MKKKTPILTHERLLSVLAYDAGTGLFSWRVHRGGGARRGDVAGTSDAKGYTVVMVDGVSHKAHRLAWFYVHQEWPADQVDHINGRKSDNRLVNLRLATHGQNRVNSRPSAKSGFKGVYYHPSGKWQAQINVDKRRKSLGLYATKEEASAAYKAAARKHHGCFARVE